MHTTAYRYGKAFFDKYVKGDKIKIVEIGSQDINGSLKDHSPSTAEYIGLDFVPGKSVDIVLQDAYHFPLADNSTDVVVTSSCFEHSQFFWETFMEALRILKPTGVMYINVPSNGPYHTYPTDNWRFYPDAAKALANYANYKGVNSTVLESFIGAKIPPKSGQWNDFVAVIIKDEQYVDLYQDRMYNTLSPELQPTQVWLYGQDSIINPPFDKVQEL